MGVKPIYKRRSQCPCAPPPSLETVQLDDLYNDWYSRKLDVHLAEIIRSNPDGVAAVCSKLPAPKTSDFKAGARKNYSFDEMVRIARGLIFGTEVQGLKQKLKESTSSFSHEWSVELKFYRYRQGVCLDCPALIDNANPSDKEAHLGQHTLRILLGLFDLNGEPIPQALRESSARSRLEAVKGKRGNPRKTWLRDDYILYTVALLAYATGRAPSSNAATENAKSACDAVLAAFKKEGVHLSRKVVLNAWFKDNKGPKLLERWLQASNQAQTPEEATVRSLSPGGH